ncbi:UNVERIFIED_CONTAM: hypothetical protein Scaly_2248900 [Sesamum calycinum]|uniref:Uncharacterized protein n=1 Tax=Sesamum calycinum TaxID=2727403 RepID=A0AAW2MCP8_9LAMI
MKRNALLILYPRRLLVSLAGNYENITLELPRLRPPWIVQTLSELSETQCKSRKHERVKEKFNYNGVSKEKQGTLPQAQWQINNIRECLSNGNLQDIVFEGDMFTWCNRRESSHTVRAHLDRACCNSCWAYLFQVARVHHENFACSDHAAVTVHMSEVTNLARVKKLIPVSL